MKQLGDKKMSFFPKISATFFALQFFVVLFVQRELHFSHCPHLLFRVPDLAPPPRGGLSGYPQNFGASCIMVSRGIATRSPKIISFFQLDTTLHTHTRLNHIHTHIRKHEKAIT